MVHATGLSLLNLTYLTQIYKDTGPKNKIKKGPTPFELPEASAVTVPVRRHGPRPPSRSPKNEAKTMFFVVLTTASIHQRTQADDSR